MSVATRPIQSPNHSAPKKGKHITIHNQRNHSHQSHYHPPNADPSRMRSSFNTLPSSYLCCALLVSWLVLASSPVPQQSPIQYLRTLDQRKLKPLRTTSTEMASSQTCLINACSPASCNKQRSWSQAIVTTNNHDKQLASTTIPRTTASLTPRSENGPATRQSHNMASMIVRRNNSHRDSQTDLTWRTAALFTRLWCLQMLEHGNTKPSPINPSNNARRQQLTRTLVATSRNAYPETTAHTPTPERHPLLRYPFGDLRDSHETALINHSPSNTTTPFRLNWTPLPHRIPSHHLPSQRLSSSI